MQDFEQKKAVEWCRRYPALVSYCEAMEHTIKNGKVEITYRDGEQVKCHAIEHRRVDL